MLHKPASTDPHREPYLCRVPIRKRTDHHSELEWNNVGWYGQLRRAGLVCRIQLRWNRWRLVFLALGYWRLDWMPAKQCVWFVGMFVRPTYGVIHDYHCRKRVPLLWSGNHRCHHRVRGVPSSAQIFRVVENTPFDCSSLIAPLGQ